MARCYCSWAAAGVPSPPDVTAVTECLVRSRHKRSVLKLRFEQGYIHRAAGGVAETGRECENAWFADYFF